MESLDVAMVGVGLAGPHIFNLIASQSALRDQCVQRVVSGWCGVVLVGW